MYVLINPKEISDHKIVSFWAFALKLLLIKMGIYNKIFDFVVMILCKII